MSEAFVSFQDVSKIYRSGEVEIRAVDDISFEIQKGEFVVIVGPSGAGKTTVLNMLGGMDACSEGTILVDGSEVSRYNARQLTEYRRRDIGFVFQFYNLVPKPDGSGERGAGGPDLPATPWTPQEVLAGRGPGRPDEQLPGPALRRRAAAGGHRAGVWPRTPSSCSATSPPAPWMTRPAGRSCSFCRTPAAGRA